MKPKLLSFALFILFLGSPAANATTYYTNTVDFSLSNGSASVLVTGDIVTTCEFCALTTSVISSFSFTVTGSLNDIISDPTHAPTGSSGPNVAGTSPLSVSNYQVDYDPSASGMAQFMEYTPTDIVTDQIVFCAPPYCGRSEIDVQVGMLPGGDDIGFPTPIPATLPLFGAGLALIGLMGWRRTRKNAAAVATA